MIPRINVQRQHEELHDEIHEALNTVIDRGRFVLGEEVRAFEEEFAAFCETRFCVCVGSGTEALALALKGFGVGRGDEVITAANTFVGTAVAIRQTGATPVLVDNDPDTYTLDPRRLASAITARTKVVVPVHLYGHPADMDAIQAVANEHDLLVIEDACQAAGARFRERRCGSLGHAAAFSFDPDSNLGAMGDGGAIVTSDESLARWLGAARNLGSTGKDRYAVRGVNSRLEEVHAAVLRVKLPYLDEWNERRRWLAAQYGELLGDTGVVLPFEREDVEHAYQLFVIRSRHRDALSGHLLEKHIGADIHYPIPIHRQVAFGRGCLLPGTLANAERQCDELLSLPLCPFLSLDDLEAVAHQVRIALATASLEPANIDNRAATGPEW